MICANCWQTVKEFHEFCLKIEKIHEDARCVVVAEHVYGTDLDVEKECKYEVKVLLHRLPAENTSMKIENELSDLDENSYQAQNNIFRDDDDDDQSSSRSEYEKEVISQPALSTQERVTKTREKKNLAKSSTAKKRSKGVVPKRKTGKNFGVNCYV